MSESDQGIFDRVKKRMDNASIRMSMGPQPSVACVMLANGRPEMVKRAVKSFRAQAYERKRLVIWDTTPGCGSQFIADDLSVPDVNRSAFVSSSIGNLRNAANKYALAHYTTSDTCADIICHWDSDDWSHPNRIAEQVALLQSSGAECVGYNEMLFWETHFPFPGGPPMAFDPGDEAAWLYRADGNKHLKNYVLGTSMCYWRSTWERFPFGDYSPGCDDLRWANGDKQKGLSAVRIVGESAIVAGSNHCDACREGFPPRMIASIHGGNACARIDSTSSGGKEVWTRAPEWDTYCREAMKL